MRGVLSRSRSDKQGRRHRKRETKTSERYYDTVIPVNRICYLDPQREGEKYGRGRGILEKDNVCVCLIYQERNVKSVRKGKERWGEIGRI